MASASRVMTSSRSPMGFEDTHRDRQLPPLKSLNFPSESRHHESAFASLQNGPSSLDAALGHQTYPRQTVEPWSSASHGLTTSPSYSDRAEQDRTSVATMQPPPLPSNTAVHGFDISRRMHSSSMSSMQTPQIQYTRPMPSYPQASSLYHGHINRRVFTTPDASSTDPQMHLHTYHSQYPSHQQSYYGASIPNQPVNHHDVYQETNSMPSSDYDHQMNYSAPRPSQTRSVSEQIVRTQSVSYTDSNAASSTLPSSIQWQQGAQYPQTFTSGSYLVSTQRVPPQDIHPSLPSPPVSGAPSEERLNQARSSPDRDHNLARHRMVEPQIQHHPTPLSHGQTTVSPHQLQTNLSRLQRAEVPRTHLQVAPLPPESHHYHPEMVLEYPQSQKQYQTPTPPSSAREEAFPRNGTHQSNDMQHSQPSYTQQPHPVQPDSIEDVSMYTEPSSSSSSSAQQRHSALSQIVTQCTILYDFASRFAQLRASIPNVSPSPEELFDHSQRADEVIKLLEIIKITDLSESERSEIEKQQAAVARQRAAKRSSDGVDVANKDSPISPVQLEGYPSPEEDMETIRKRRLATTATANAAVVAPPVVHPKGKYKKRNRTNPPGKCHSCNSRETPEWRRGPDGARTLCNACGLHFAKMTKKREKSGEELPPIDIEMLRASARAADASAEKGVSLGSPGSASGSGGSGSAPFRRTSRAQIIGGQNVGPNKELSVNHTKTYNGSPAANPGGGVVGNIVHESTFQVETPETIEERKQRRVRLQRERERSRALDSPSPPSNSNASGRPAVSHWNAAFPPMINEASPGSNYVT